MTIETPELTKRITMPAFSFGSYSSPENTIEYSPGLVKTKGCSCYDLWEQGSRMSTAAEELAMQFALERMGQDPRKAKDFADLFGRNPAQWYAWQWTDTGLRVPKSWEHGRCDNGKYPRIVLIGDQEIAEIVVPAGCGRYVTEWNEAFGIPSATGEDPKQINDYTTKFWFSPTPPKDERTDRYDVAIGRRSSWVSESKDSCLYVDATRVRSNSCAESGFRPVSDRTVF